MRRLCHDFAMLTFPNRLPTSFANEPANGATSVLGGLAIIEAVRGSGGALWLTATGVAHSGLSAAQLALVHDNEAEIIDLLRREAEREIISGQGRGVDGEREAARPNWLVRPLSGFGIPPMTNLRNVCMISRKATLARGSPLSAP